MLFFYYVLHDRKKEVTDEIPYATIINKELIGVEDAILIKNKTYQYTDQYAMELRDMDNYDKTLNDYITVPKGSVYSFHKAVAIKNGNSGNTFSYLLGEVTLKNTNRKYPIIYLWGTLNSDIYQKSDDYWSFGKAPWQEEKDTKKYQNN